MRTTLSRYRIQHLIKTFITTRSLLCKSGLTVDSNTKQASSNPYRESQLTDLRASRKSIKLKDVRFDTAVSRLLTLTLDRQT